MIPASSRTAAAALGAAVVLVPLIYLPGIFEFTLLPRLFLLQALLLIALIGWTTASLRTRADALYAPPLTLPMVCYVCLVTLSAFWAVNPIEALVQISRTFTLLLLALLAAYALRPAAIRTVYTAAAATGAVISCIGIAQYFGWGFAGIPSVGNPSATFGYRNFAASYLVISIPATAAFAWTSASRPGQIAGFLSAAMMTLFLIYTRTRGAWVGFGGALLIGVFALIWLSRKHHIDLLNLAQARTRLLVAGACLLLVALLALLPHGMQKEGAFRFDERKSDAFTTLAKTFSPADARGRLTVWRHTLEMVRDHPLLGVGPGNWQYRYPRYDKGDWITDNAAPQRPHNDFLWILSETGILGLIAYLWMIYTLCKTVWARLRHHPGAPHTLWAFGLAVGILALLGHSLFSFPRERIAPSMMLWMGLGCIASLTANPVSRRIRPHRLFRPAMALAAALILCSLTLTYRHIRFDAHYLRALTAWRQEDWSRVVTQANQALIWGPLNYRIFLIKGLAHHKLGDRQQAVDTYKGALNQHPNDGHAALAAAYLDLGRYDLAETHYRIEQQLFPKSYKPALGLAQTFAASNKWTNAANAYRDAIEKNAPDPDACIGLADAYRHLNRWDDAIRTYRKILMEIPPSADIYAKLGSALQAGGDLNGALDAYTRAHQLSPDDPSHHNNLGAVYMQMGRFEDAERAYREAVRIRPNYARAYHNLGDLYAATGKARSAVKAYERFIQTWKGDSRFLELAKKKIQELKDKR